MTDCETGRLDTVIQRSDTVDTEAADLLLAFYAIKDHGMRAKIIGIVRNIPYDEDAAVEIMNLAARALHRPDTPPKR